MEVRRKTTLPAAVLSLEAALGRCRTKPGSKAVGESSGRRHQKLIQQVRINKGPVITTTNIIELII